MTWVIVGLGNPGEEYEHTRHNTGRMAVQHFVRSKKIGEWKEDAKAKSLVARGMVERSLAAFVLPETFMNKSGGALTKFVKSMKAAENLVVVYDELDLPLGAMKISYDRGSGGHKGIESIMRAVKTKKFWRIRIGVSQSTAGGEIKKPHGGKAVNDFILDIFKPHEHAVLKTVFKRVENALESIIVDGPERAMNQFNS
ncbi:MAG: peptidyl-tRNA hydrolase, PTH1 family [Parcubacteria group bacterium Gr01-1014_8]|nr:MAG: peptidyl-tRNA hydrolase, PTH1 family [Parcubacteria group bacterium Gr01-1014_8]